MKAAGARPVTPAAGRAGTPVGIDVAAGAVLVVVAGLVAAAVPAAGGPARLVVLAVAVGLFAALAVDPVALAVVVLLACLVDNGFLVDRQGQLDWHGWPDVYRIGSLVAAAGLGLAVGAVGAWVRRTRARRRVGDRWYAPLAGAHDAEGEARRDG
jgi:hypothetical protein